jgi:hypothetical protein
MDGMKTNIKNLLCSFGCLVIALAFTAVAVNAQPPSATPTPGNTKKNNSKSDTKKADLTPTSMTTGEDAGDFTVTSSFEVGYRGIRVRGDENKYRSDLNYKAGPRLFDSSFLVQAKNGKREIFDTLMVTSSGWGADPTGSFRLSVESPKWYRFEAQYRRAKYFRFLNNIANPNWLFSGFPVPPNPVTGLHGYNTRTEFGDFDLTILPKNELIRFNVGYSPEHYSGPFFSNYHQGGNEFQLLVNSRTRANDYRVGADGKLGPIDWTFMQGFRRFRDDSFVDNIPAFINPNPTNTARFTSFNRNEPTRGSVNFTRASIHSFIAERVDITGRIVYSKSKSDSTFIENGTGTNFNTRISGALGPPNVLVLGQYIIPSNVERPSWIGDLGVTVLATDKLRLSNTFRIDDFTIDGVATFNDLFILTRGAITDTRSFTNLSAFKTTKYRKYSDTIEGDYQFNPKYSIHFGYRYGQRHEEQTLTGFNLGSNAPTPVTPEFEEETNHTHAFFGGFKARPMKNWTIYFDAEHGSADNVFTRIGNYNYTNIRAKSRFAPNRKLSFNLGLITKNNSNPSEIAGVSLSDFGVEVKTRTFTSSVDWNPNAKLSISTGYNYNWVNSDAVIDYFYQVPPAASVRHPMGHALYFQRNNYFYLDLVARLHRRVTLYSSYRLNQDDGQGDRLPDPAGNPGTLITSYPMSFQSPEARLAIRVNRHLDWNLGYQYYNYNEDDFLRTFPGSPRAQNYHAHLPYMSLRVYIGRKE